MNEFETNFNGMMSLLVLITVFVSLIWQPAVFLMLIEAMIALAVNLFIYHNK